MSDMLKLTVTQAKALQRLGSGVNGAPLIRYNTADSLCRRGLVRFTRDGWWPRADGRGYTTQRDWEAEITDAGRALLAQWSGTQTWLKLTKGNR